MKPPRLSNASSLAVAIASLLAAQAARAADSSWNVNADGDWATGANWASAAPGATSGTASTDIATFGYTLTAPREVTVDANRNIGGITFANTSPSGFTLSGSSLLLSSGGTIQTTGSTGLYTDTITSSIKIQGNAGTAFFTASAVTATSSLALNGSVTGVSGTGSTTTLTLNGSNIGNNIINGGIGNGVNGGALAITKAGAGNWVIAGTNSYSGATAVNEGRLTITTGSGLGDTTGSTTVASGANLYFYGGTMTIGNESLMLSGTGSAGEGALTNNGDTTYGGLVTLAADTRINSVYGILDLTNTGTIGTSGVGNYNLTLGGSSQIQIKSAIGTGSGTLTKDGIGAVTLYHDSTYTGATLVSQGVLNIRANDALGTAAGGVTVNATAGAALEMQGNITVGNEALNIGGTGVGGAGALHNVSGDNTYGGLLTLSAATRINSDSGLLALSNTGTITGSGFGVTVGGASNTTISSIIGTGSGTLTKDGAGTLTLNGANTYSGLTTVSGGTLILANGAAITNAGGVQLDNTAGALLQLTDSETIGYLTGGGSTGGNIQLGTKTLTVGDASSNPYAGAISSTSSTGSLVKQGSGTITLSGASSYTGTTTITSGILSVGAANNIGDGSSTNSLSIGAGTLKVTDTFSSARNVSVTNAAATISVDSTKTYTNTGTVSGTGSSGALTKTGTGTLVLTGNNSYEGLTTVSAGVLNIQHANALGATGAGKTTVVTSGAALQLQSATNMTVAAEALNIGGAGVGATGGALRNISGNNTYSGLLTLSAETRINSDSDLLTLSNVGTITGSGFGLIVGGASNTTISSIIGTVAGTLTKDGAGTLTLTGISTYTGITTLTEGLVSVSSIGNYNVAGPLGKGGTTSTNTPSKLVFNGGTLQYTGATASTTRGFTINDGKIATVDVNSTSANLTISGGSVADTGGLTKLGSGTLTLSNDHAYSGSTTVSAGTLNITGTLTTDGVESTVTVGGTGSSGTPTLAGSGTISGATILAAEGTGVVGIHSPGGRITNGTASVVGLQTFESTLTYETGSIFKWDLNSYTADTADRGVEFDGVDMAFSQKAEAATGTNANLTIVDGAIFELVLGSVSFNPEVDTALFWNSPHSWQVFDDTVASGINLFSTVGNFTVDATAANYTPYYPGGGFSFDNTNGTLNWTAVPEPTSALAGLLLGAGLLRRRRK